MRKIILAVFVVVMLTTPCLAREIEPDGIFSLNGTVWNTCYVVLELGLPFVEASCEGRDMAFYQGTVYFCDDAKEALLAWLQIRAPQQRYLFYRNLHTWPRLHP